MTRETLQFVHAARPPATDGIRVFDALTRAFLGAEFTFRVIGSSHYVSAPAYEFHELSACDLPPTADCEGTATTDCEGTTTADCEGTTIPLEPDRPSRRLDFETPALRCETTVDHRPLAAFPHDRFRSRPESFDLAYAFDGPEAVTTIEIDDGANAYETYHTYPEFDLALYTRTEFTVVDESAASALEAAQSTASGEVPEEPAGRSPGTTDGTRRESPNTF